MHVAVGALFVLHGLIHLMGMAKAFGLAELPQLTQPISPAWGVGWGAAAALLVATAVSYASGSRTWWAAGILALVISQVVITSSWHDAWAGSLANAVLLVVVVHGALTEGPWSLHARFLREAAAAAAAQSGDATLVTEADLAALPPPVQRYLRVAGVVGQPRVRSYRVRFTGRIRSGPSAAWMPFTAEQVSAVAPPMRLFLMRARMRGVPVEAFHRLSNGHATMQVTAAGLVTVMRAEGPDMDRSETVTLFNDMCLLAPGTLVGKDLAWEAVDATTARARFTHRGQQITATLTFAPDGTLANFVSPDRAKAGDDGTFTPLPFATPVRGYRAFGPLWLAGHGEARWTEPAGDYAYGEFTMTDVVMNAPP